MNLVLVEPDELDGTRATICGRRARHVALVHRAEPGRTLRVGVLGGRVGSGTVVRCSADRVELDVTLEHAPPAALACTLVLALPRPKVLRRVLAAVAAFGIKNVVLTGAQRVEKSYWQSPALDDDAMRDELLQGLEQAGDTLLPLVEQRRRLRPFVEDELAGRARGSLAIVAHPASSQACPRAGAERVTVVVGPEGGFTDFELDLLCAAGMRPVTLGTRPLRVEHAISALVGRLF
ncbi:MAG TPA: 16S rRNA (uracil(1498)-N(3))-methyltransferase [Candidatus Limnocylindrales bacterium]|nr:16S rRNA (uracil(1498)-N(3))-methyltransferase [Candidatus Limnocylindrales bacterium]